MSDELYSSIVIGNDLFALAKFRALQQDAVSESSVVLVSEYSIEHHNKAFVKRPWPLRGKANIQAFEKAYPQIALKKDHKKALFLKEGRLKSFGGRARPEKLLWGEEFYTYPRAYVNTNDLSSLFGCLPSEDNIDNQVIVKDKVVGITRSQEASLTTYHLALASGRSILGKKIYWGEEPWAFLKLYSQRDELSTPLVTFCSSSKTPTSLYVDFTFHKPITSYEETIFIPLSYTYDHGHFIGEFFREEEKYKASFLTFVNVDEEDEEGVSRNIRLLKGRLQKIFPSFRKNLAHEAFLLNEQTAGQGMNSEFLLNANIQMDNIYFIGLNGMIQNPQKWSNVVSSSLDNISHLTRGLLSLVDGPRTN